MPDPDKASSPVGKLAREQDDLLHRPLGLMHLTLEELNEQIPAHEFLEFIDSGGMGAVYKARQRSLDRIVAVKVLPVLMSNRKAFSDRFKREVRALALLNHPGIVSVYDFGEATGGSLYYVMEYVKGTTLRELIREGRTTSRRLLSMAMQVCEALQFAHMHGIVHRDVKPANILLDERGMVKVADFGLAKVIGPCPGHDLTAQSDAIGTPEYMAPEAVTHQHEIDHRADIYSLGVLLYEVLTGHVPRGVWEPPSRSVGADARFDDVVSRAMQTDPQKRFQNIGELTRIMKQLVQSSDTKAASPPQVLERDPTSSPVSSSAPTQVQKAPPARPRFPRLALVMVAIVAALVGGAGFSYLKDKPFIRSFLGEVPPPVSTATAGQHAQQGHPSPQARQAALARFVLAHGGFVNVTDAFRSERRMGSDADLRYLNDLPKGEFMVWRVSLDDRTFTDEDLAALVRLCEAAGTVTNVNLHGSGITARGLTQITRLADTMVSLKLTETEAFTAESLPFLAACRNLRLLFVSGSQNEATNTHIEAEMALVHRLRDVLPGCDVHLE